MKNKFYKMFHLYRKLKKLTCQIGLAQEELRETNEELETQKKKLEKTVEMRLEKQEEFSEICLKIHEIEEKLMDIQEKYYKEAKMLNDIILRYKVLYSDYKKIDENLERFRRRTVGMEREDIKFNIPYMDIENWMARTTIIDPVTGNRTTIAELCLVAFMKEKKEEDSIWAELQATVRESKNQLARTVPEVV